MSKSIKNLSLYSIFFLFLSAENSFALFQALVIRESLYQKSNIKVLCVLSFILDVYCNAFVGISLISVVVLVFFIKNYFSLLKNQSSEVLYGYLFLILCFIELVKYFFIILFGGNFALDVHLLMPIKTLFVYSIISLIDRSRRVTR